MSDEFVTLANDSLELVFWPACGGRLISLKVEGAELLWRSADFFDGETLARPRSTWPALDGSMASWANVGGSKTWPAPQGWSGPGEWPGPPDPVLDSGIWSIRQAERDGAREVTLASPVDPRSGLQVTRQFTLPGQGRSFRQLNTFTNASDSPIRWSIWEVCQADTAGCEHGGELRVSVSDGREPQVMIEAFGTMPVGTVRDGQRVLRVPEAVGKLGFPNATGSVELARPDGAALRLEFVPDPAASYPDGGSRVELWLQCPIAEPLAEFSGLHPRAWLAELEVLGPLRTLMPGETSSLEILWSARPPA